MILDEVTVRALSTVRNSEAKRNIAQRTTAMTLDTQSGQYDMGRPWPLAVTGTVTETETS